MVSQNQLRIRNNGTVKRIKVTPEKLEHLKDVLKTPIPEWRKEAVMKDITGVCCVCRNIPSMQVSYDMNGATKIEKYCDSCIQKVYAREQVL